MKAGQIIESAAALVGGDRRDAYGADPMPGFAKIATLWNGLLIIAGKATASPIDEHDVAQMMVSLKQARAYTGPLRLDHYIDEAGWAALAGEAAVRLAKSEAS